MITRRDGLRGVLGVSAAAGLSGCGAYPLAPSTLLDAADGFTFAAQRLLIPNDSLAREFPVSAVSWNFPAINTISPEDETYHRERALGFPRWRLPVTGLVRTPRAYALAELKQMPARTQITQHNCVDGWSAIAQWTGVPLFRVLAHAGLMPEARFVVVHCVDGWWDSYDLVDALHPQTILAYGMNGEALPMRHGAPVRLRVERQLGYKSLKFVTRIEAVARIDRLGEGRGSFAAEYGYQWHAGI